MSRTTDIILFLGILDDEDAGSAKAFNQELLKIVEKPWFLLQPLGTDSLEGPKVFTSEVHAVTWNNMQYLIDELTDMFKRFEWKDPEHVVLIVEDEQNDIQILRPEGVRHAPAIENL